MKKLLLLLFTAVLSLPVLRAQNPDAIYIATWVTMADLGQPVTPSDSDPKLSYNAESGCYEGEVIDWPRLEVNPYNAKIPYSVTDGVITYYGVAGSTQFFTFNSSPSQSFKFQASQDPKGFKGFGLSQASEKSIVDVKVSMNLTTNEITFSEFESGQGTVLPQLVSVEPENGSEITLNDDGGVVITVTFDGSVTGMDAVSEEGRISVESSDDGKVWTIAMSAEAVQSSLIENDGKLILKIQKVYANGLPVNFPGNKSVLDLVYTVAGMSTSTVLEFTGDAAGLETLNVYKSPYYSVGDQIDFEGDSFDVVFNGDITYLFTVADGYSIEVTSSVDSGDGENWKLGEGYSTEKGPNGETTSTPAQEGVTLTIYSGSNGATFLITVTDDAGVESLVSDKKATKVYDLNGVRVNSGLDSLKPGLYIINGKKVLVK